MKVCGALFMMMMIWNESIKKLFREEVFTRRRMLINVNEKSGLHTYNEKETCRTRSRRRRRRRRRRHSSSFYTETAASSTKCFSSFSLFSFFPAAAAR